MAKGRMSRNLSGLVAAVILALGVFLCAAALPGTGLKDSPARIAGQYATLLPDEVIVYEHADFVGKYRFFRVMPGMRQKLVPDLELIKFNDVISSIQVGSEVGVMVFEHADFRDTYHYLAGGNPWYRSYFDSQKVLPDNMNDCISSLIVFRKNTAVGVVLADNREFKKDFQFFPLPELEKDTEARYSTLGPMDDDANWVQLNSQVRVTLYESPDFRGRWITLPGADGSGDTFTLGTYSFDDTASSLIVRWVGPPAPLIVQPSMPAPLPAPSTSARVSAPSAPDTTPPAQNPSDRTPLPPGSESVKAAPNKTPTPPYGTVMSNDISGQWNSNIGAVYQIQQTGNDFTWSAPSLSQSGTGTISGKNITLSGPGWTVKGQITETDASGNPTKIVGENGVILMRAAGAAPGTPTAPSAISLAGQWKSALGLIYNITQQGSQFAWTVVNSDEKGQGTITGSDVSASWKGLLGSGSSSGKITVDSSGKATEIKWENGVRFFR
jgi:hypothetical protein